ncbi:MAG: glycine--tRNA ligase [Bdellovibrionales bacterium RIFOXYD12_FULL_39_22]|nr:MAG: glycine--tRNA ligase [Bdellovibrionales bacterium RIFOXYB1_FULL_39_21]OFZ40860.1 MAG: glycine--tRNA ligase [Bdellovibrionales bacterium RIFOXYC12_FULL_39_17]OFZ44401.1 MAG: glycine--tRNA ligase [Bdellovibrionales bacterium RIFOXYC1_FULL_39_130]OFZ72416.1 MAG: glycine--tRNA ligase [Bdellovibrionales bacterium RIFOXYC2_FULL_39_8]OFZ74148.1 MAG: glycine--tRNA ligase [Bdellovibrionales bacterium RIFOXYD1_FULL_39_84]OFZ91997.1 MAG: glycine--tRNA ligase [Bdellovibrionales bacterium RIFOXYD12
MSESNLKSMAELVSLSKRRGYVFQSSEIYGGLGSCWDYGPLGVELKKNIQARWWKAMTYREDISGIDASILMHPTVWKASGHIDNFTDPLVDCKKCKARFREDQIDLTKPCPACGEKGSFTEPRAFNLMFSTKMGAVEDAASTIYLRPETCQGIFTNFLNVQATMRLKLPFGIAQIGKAFRNEITPGNFIFRTREFEQMEMQYFVRPGTQMEHMEKWKEIRWNWHLENGLRPERLRWAPHTKLAHYADAAIDIEYEFPMGWGEMEGIHSRTNFDLTQHQQYSGKNLQYVDQADNNNKYIPYVIETSVGSDRTILALMCDAYRLENEGGGESERTVMRFKPDIAPIKVAVLPLMKKTDLEDKARPIFADIQKNYRAEYDTSGSIGKRYRRQDEIGTPFCITVDYDSLTDNAVTVRERDSMKQERIAIDNLKRYLSDKLQLN